MSVSRLQRFKEVFEPVDLAEYYQMNKPYEKMNIVKDIHSDYIVLTIQYKKSGPSLEFELPSELNQMIREYLIYVIEIQIKIKYSPSYPFSPPVWFLQRVNHNLNTSIGLLDYYSYKVNQHNQGYTAYLLNLGTHSLDGWTPAITVEKDILSFLQKIYHFDEVLDCL